ncbi:MAG TPA: polysaccharide biosynthesis/export family protein [Longimicrobiaceae bacterium]|nr:polysaccharide biosynthesis/export family protein [Longimicrobiaceae bacterium]
MKLFRLLALASLLVAAAVPARAQGTVNWDPKRVHVTRQDLQELLTEYEQLLASSSHSGQYKERIRVEAEAIRTRLRDGDVQVGDQVAVFVEGNQELSDTFTVRPGPVLFLPTIGDVPVGGLLRSEMGARVAEHLARYIVDPVVRVQPLMRVAVAGQVGSPGFYTVPSESLISDLLMAAGGPTGTADLRRVYVERRGAKLVEGEVVQQAISEGRTLDQMNFRPGDQIHVPQVRQRVLNNPWAITQAIGATVALVGLIARVL